MIKTGLGAQLGYIIYTGVVACVADLFTFPLDTLKIKTGLNARINTFGTELNFISSFV